MRPIRLSLLVASVLAALQGVAPAAGPVALKGACDLLAIDPRTGAVLAINREAKRATLYPKAYVSGAGGAVVGPAEIAAGARHVVFKRYKDKAWFLISFSASTQIEVLDAKTLKSAGKIVAKRPVNRVLACGTDPDDPYVYCASGFYEGGGCVSMKTLAWVGPTGVRGTDIVVSADGNYMYSKSVGVSPTGFDGFRKVTDPDTGKPTWIQVYDEHESVPGYVPGPFSRYCAVGGAIRTVDLVGHVAKLDFAPDCFFRTRPVIVGVSDDQVTAASYNTFKSFGSVAVPAKLRKSSDPDRRRWDEPPIFCVADDANGRVVLGGNGHLAAITLAELSVPDEPFLICDVQAPPQLTAGRAAKLPAKPQDRRCAVRLKEAPEGMKYAPGVLTWTPSAGQIGPTKVVLELSGGGVKVDQTIRLNVVQPGVDLPLAATDFAVSPDGTRAVAWTGGGRDRWGHLRGEAPAHAKIALVDLTKMTVLAAKAVPYPVSACAVDAHFVYVAPANGDRVNALELKGLTRRSYTMVQSAVTHLLAVGDKRLVARTERHGPRVFDVPALKRADSPVASAQSDERFGPRRYMSRDRGEMPVKVGRNWYAAGCLFGPALTTARMLVNVTGLPMVGSEGRGETVVPLPWNRVLTHNGLTGRTGQRIAEYGQAPTALLTDVPVAASLVVSVKRPRRAYDGETSSTRSAALHLRELVGGKVVQQVPLMSGVLVARDGRGERDTAVVRGSGRTVLALVGRRLFIHALDDATLKQFPPPFAFEPLAAVPNLDLDKPTVIRTATVGGAAPVEFELLGSARHMEIDTKTGAVTVSSPAIAKLAVERLASDLDEVMPGLRTLLTPDPRSYRYPRGLPDVPGAGSLTPKQAVAQLSRRHADRLKAFTGREPKGIPVLVPVRVAATDKHQQVASMQFQAVLDLPKERLLTVIEAAVAKAKAELAAAERAAAERERQMEAERQRRQKEMDLARRRAASQPADPDTIRRLEKRLERLETQVQLLMKLIAEQRGGR